MFFIPLKRSPAAPFFSAKMEKREKAGSDILTNNKKLKLGGAPTKYQAAYCQKMIDYFLEYVDKNLKGMPQFEVFAVHELKVTPQTLINWKNSHEKFAEAYEVCKDIQKSYVINKGLAGENNPRMTQFILSTCFRMSEYAKRKPAEERADVGLTEGDRRLLNKIEERLAQGNVGGRPEFSDGITFGEMPFDDGEELEDDESE